MQLLNSLNDQQLTAVTSESKTIRCLAGAGSGKTRVLTSRIAYLHDEKRVGTSNMLALTFTRLAAKEMKDRLNSFIGEQEGKKLFCGTFHSFCVMVIREWGHLVGIEPNFTIYDEEDRVALLQTIVDDLGANKVKYKDIIDNMQVWDKAWPEGDMGRVAHEYYYRLKQHNALDLDLLLHSACQILENEKAQEYYHKLYKYVFVDEFQDTSSPQARIISLLKPDHLFVVGDDFQSIYGWRGANPYNLIHFGPITGFPEAETIKLETNYRSTMPIVAAANQLIAHNQDQTEKTLVTDRPGPSICYFEFNDEDSEYSTIAATILGNKGPRSWSDLAVLARTNSQLQRLKEVLNHHKVPCQIVNAGGDIFKKPAVKGVLDFITAASNPTDNIAVKKAFGFPSPRATALQMSKWELEVLQNDIPLLDVIENSPEPGAKEFDHLIRNMRGFLKVDVGDMEDIFGQAYRLLGLEGRLQADGLQNRLDDIQEALSQIIRWKNVQRGMGSSTSSEAFLRWLRTKDIQERLLQEEQDAVKLLTIHAAKGLEFPVVFIVGMNQGVFPSKRSENLEEERRLFYVAITRAKEMLIVSRALNRIIWGDHTEPTDPSQFLEEAGIKEFTEF